MKRTVRWALVMALSVLTVMLNTGCSFRLVTSPEELYTLPKLPTEYTALDSIIQTLLAYGMEYAAPVSGANTQNVQLMDLNGDGSQEAVVFLRNATEGQPLRVHIYEQSRGGYAEKTVIAGSGTSIYSFNACDMNGDGWMELLIGWETGTEMRALTIHSLREQTSRELLRTGYGKYTAEDLNRDGLRELVVFRTDEQGSGIADLYVWKDGMEKTSSTKLSFTVAELKTGSVVLGTLRDGQPALFVSGIGENGAALTDVLSLKEAGLENITLSEFTGITTEIFHHRGQSPEDINGDGITEIPAAVPLTGSGGETENEYCRIDWYQYGSDGLRHPAISTYHNMTDGWYLELLPAWTGRISLMRHFISADETAVTFYRQGQNAPFLRICAITGAGRELKAARGNRIVLSRQTDVIYTAELLAANGDWDGSITEDELRSKFHLIARKWTEGDN